MDFLWIPFGVIAGFLHIPYGFPFSSLCIPYAFPIYSCSFPFKSPFNDIINEDLRVEYYHEVWEKLKVAKARVEDKNPPEFRALVDNILAVLSLMDDGEKADALLQLGLSLGFKCQWLKKAKKEKKKTMVERAEKLAESLLAVSICH